MNNLQANYERILEVLRKIAPERLLPAQRRRPSMSDLEVISLSLTAEYIGVDSENDLFRKLPACLYHKIERTVYNRRKRRLMPYQNAIRLKLAESFNESEEALSEDDAPPLETYEYPKEAVREALVAMWNHGDVVLAKQQNCVLPQ